MLKPLLVAASLVAFVSVSAQAQDTIKIGEINSYKAQPAFLDPYKKGWELAVEEVNAAGGVLGKKLQVISRDDNGNPGDAVRVAGVARPRPTRSSSPRSGRSSPPCPPTGTGGSTPCCAGRPSRRAARRRT